MREIKFRAWDVEANRMVYPWTKIGDLPFEYSTEDIFSHYNNEFLMQCTGLKDKNGKEIYEGDLLHYYWKSTLSSSHKPVDRLFEVVYKNEEGRFLQLETYRDELSYREDANEWYDWNDLELVGNIYENPNLLQNNHEDN